jgi:hypothetical protein
MGPSLCAEGATVTTAAPAASSATRTTVFGLIAEHGLVPAPAILDLVRLGAAAQHERHVDKQVSDVGELTRSTALWAVAELDDGIAEALEACGIDRSWLSRILSLKGVPEPAPVDDVEVHDDLAAALRHHFSTVTARREIDLADIAIAVLRGADTMGGLLATRLADGGADVAGALRALQEGHLGAADVAEAAGEGTPTPELPPMSQAAELYLGYHQTLSGRTVPAQAGAAEDWPMWAAFGLVAARRTGTLATLVTRVVLQLRGERASTMGQAAAARAFGVPDDVEPAPLRDPDELAGSALLREAARVRDRVDPGEIVHLRHLVAGAIEQGLGPRGPATREADLEALRAAFLDQIDLDAPSDVAARWRAYFADRAASQRSATERPPEAPSGRAVAGLTVDLVDEDTKLGDELNVLDDVLTLCDVIAARDAPPPISVGLFGRWGSGKSYFMALMRRRIEEIQQVASAARKNAQDTAYCSEIVQVNFNAWHYMDADDLWASLAVHLFGAIAQVDPDDHRARPRADVIRDLQEREQRMQTVDRRLTRLLGDQRLDAAAERMGMEPHRAAVLGLLHEVGTTAGLLSAVKVLSTRAWWSGQRRWATLGALALVLTLAVLAVVIASGALSSSWLLAWIPVAVTALGAAVRWLTRIRDGLAQVNRIAAESGLQPRDVTAARIANDGEILTLRAELEAIDRLTDMRDFVERRALSTDYSRHFGVISVLRGDLEVLVQKQRRDAPDRRIILYIDDLDRCSPSRVVEVLQAVHLLLAFPLFVAVVGVDPRWLLRSLERHYRQVLSTAAETPQSGDDLLTETTPHDYLEKIFQIPFSLRPMEPGGYGRLIDSLAGPAGAGPPSAPRREPGRDVDRDAEDAPGRSGPVAAQPTRTGGPGPSGVAQPGPRTLPAAGIVPERHPDAGPDPADPGYLAQVSANPPQLQLTAPEVAALGRMGPLIGTPRAAKRLVNLYRLIRAGLPDAAIKKFVAEAQFRPLVIVLAAQVGFPRVASTALSSLVSGRGDVPLTACLAGLAQARAEDETRDDRTERASLVAALRAICIDEDGRPVAEFDRPASELREWIPRLRRYSFEGALDQV